MSEWRSIDSAPRDGSEFLAYDHVARKMDVCIMQDWGGRAGWVCCPVQMDGEYGPLETEFGYDRDNITMWMPLPEPPQ